MFSFYQFLFQHNANYFYYFIMFYLDLLTLRKYHQVHDSHTLIVNWNHTNLSETFTCILNQVSKSLFQLFSLLNTTDSDSPIFSQNYIKDEHWVDHVTSKPLFYHFRFQDSIYVLQLLLLEQFLTHLVYLLRIRITFSMIQ